MKSLLDVFGVVACGAAIATLVSCGGSSSSNNSNPPIQSSFTVTALVSDGVVPAAHTDPNLKNPWGVTFNPKGFVWVADNGTNVATLYDGNGVPQSLVVTIPDGKNGSASPTGIVFNGTQSFTVSENGKSGVAAFIFAGEGGTITAWAPAVGPTDALRAFSHLLSPTQRNAARLDSGSDTAAQSQRGGRCAGQQDCTNYVGAVGPRQGVPG